MTMLRYSAPRLGPLFFFAGIGALVIALAAILFAARGERIREAEISAASKAAAIENHVHASLFHVDLLLRRTLVDLADADMRVAVGVQTPRAAAINRNLRLFHTLMPETAVIGIANAAGDYIYHSHPKVPRVNLADRDYFRVQQAAGNADRRVTDFVHGRSSGVWNVIVTRRINFSDGSFAGVILAGVPANYYREMLGKTDVGNHGRIAFLDPERRLIAAWPADTAATGQKVAIPWVEAGRTDGAGRGVRTVAATAADPVETHAFHIMRDHPFVVAVGLSAQDYLAEWRTLALGISLAAALMLLLASMLAFLGRHRLRQARQLRTLGVAIDQSPVSIIITDTAGVIEYVNAACCHISGYERAELVGAKPSLVRSNAHGSDFYAQMWRTVSQGRQWRGEICNRRKNGDLLWEDMSISPVVDDDGAIIHYVGLKLDVTARKEADGRLAGEVLRYRQLASRLPVGLAHYGTDMRITYVNERWNKIFHATAGMFDGYDLGNIANHALCATFRSALEGRDGFFEGRYRAQPANTDIAILCRTAPMVDAHGAIVGGICIADDIAARLAADKALLESRARMEDACMAKSRFLSKISHELRTPMNGIQGGIELLAWSNLDDSQRGYLDLAKSSAERLHSLLNDLLAFAGGDDNAVAPDRQLYSPSVLRDALSRKHAAAAARKGLAFSWQPAPHMPTHLLGDARCLERILDNLLDNAVKFTEAGGVDVTEDVSAPHDDAKIRFTVSDTGIGIPPNYIPKLFDSFSQADDSLTRRFEGAGIGLALCRRLAERMGGTIGVESVPGRGSSFRLEVPCQCAGKPDGGEAP